ncbi:MAG: heavy-metal-associated domain-containing protein [Bacteroidales bacterium]|nr:heavy-metal-associated domain-containing protein [Bacteroidales bacterium]MDZ4204998.1 heavy-metal-associated domain-containing protein [Bacteroidales bacterium]
MNTLRFKTNLKCDGCVNTIAPFLEQIPGLMSWKVNLASPDRILEVTAEPDLEKEIMSKVRSAGYLIDRLS